MLTRDVRRLALIIGPVLVLLYVTVKLYGISSVLSVPASTWDETLEEPSAEPGLTPDLGSSDGKEAFPETVDLDEGDIQKDAPNADADPNLDSNPGAIPQDALADSDSSSSPVVGDTHDLDSIPDAVPESFAEGLAGSFPESIPEGTQELHDEVTTHDSLTNMASPESFQSVHQEIFSLSTNDHKFFTIDFGQEQAMNPNIIPHPTIDNTWVVVAQLIHDDKIDTFAEIVCEAVFQDHALRCLHAPTILPIAATPGDNCKDDLAFFNLNIGPHDARVFYGPDRPYTVFGSNSKFTCFGQFIQDANELFDWGPPAGDASDFSKGTELQRPPPWGQIEKNWFPFWDVEGKMYIHYDVSPKRIFAQLKSDGSVGPDLAPFAEAEDEQCLAKYMPEIKEKLESVHQATNSLQITMCRQSDESCIATEENTFIFTIFQQKTYYSYHSVYEPYVMLFQQRAPFAVHAISRRPLWIHGREQHPEFGTADMFYVTSMSWKARGKSYHGFLDDELFLAFGIEDERAGGIDLQAGHLLEDLGLCNET